MHTTGAAESSMVKVALETPKSGQISAVYLQLQSKVNGGFQLFHGMFTIIVAIVLAHYLRPLFDTDGEPHIIRYFILGVGIGCGVLVSLNSDK